MTDDEINRKVAEIEGWWREVDEDGNYFHSDPYMNRRHGGLIEPPPYATDWQWCGPLVEKHDIQLLHNLSNSTAWRSVCKFYANGWKMADCIADTPQRAICLAVIAAAPTPATLPPEAPIHDSGRS